MRFMVMVRADKTTEAGALPDEKILTEMGKYNEELMKAGVLLAGEGLQPSSKGAGQIPWREANRDGRSLRRDERADRRLLDVPGGLEGRGDRMGQALSQSARG